MDQELVLALRERAVSALETSTTMLEVAHKLLKQGNNVKAPGDCALNYPVNLVHPV